MLTKRGIILCIFSIALIIYLMVAIALSHKMATDAPCNGVKISVTQNELSQFVTAEDIDHELGGIVASAKTMTASQINLKDIETRLNALSIIESVNCRRLANDEIAIDVDPMTPVARVFDNTGSYYINKAGKHLLASPRYQIDVPVVISENDSLPNVGSILPLLERIEENEVWSQLVSALKVDNTGDIFIIPSITGHVVNIGDGSDIDDKMKRLFAFYNQVLEVKGWNYYDTISVKFSNQVIGRIIPSKMRNKTPDYSDLEFEEEIDVEMISERDSVNFTDIKPKIL
ncbi:MAG: cell division protein FtsQ/DivIB [Muribaculaceae bacterium]|nr:cell division protein FtsQ/DivIB [Muribaculaceae bacterium]